ncbi:hypothetical protein JVT61DRAFT_14783 [Boletus reticuloceps]|uniref:Uncharacterized protein n=1 Tax=Boletus reticuloceps TaxID=495285 RepID=A0A8I2YV66_9AGAM|nr:hypothetical protein JVT61DRAFT_14783 [Boletus reticuloceps]
MTEPITELLMPKAPQIHISGDVILLDIDNLVPGWETYTFSLDEKKIVLRIKHRDTNSVQVQTGTEPETKNKNKNKNVNMITSNKIIDDEEISIDRTTGDYIRCPVIPCHLLIRRISNQFDSLYTSRYLIRTFDAFYLPHKISEKRVWLEGYNKERLNKRLRLM